MNTAHYRTQDVAPVPAGWRVRTVAAGEHLARIAFPPGARRTGAGKVVQILHPQANPACQEGSCVSNPAELVILGNPSQREQQRAARERAQQIRRAAGRNPGDATSETEQGVRLFQAFHGKDPHEIIEAQRSTAMRLDYVCLGPLLGVAPYVEGLRIPSPDHWFKGGYPVLRFEGVKLTSNAAGTQLYALEGDQDLSGVLDEFPDVDPEKDLLDLGEIAFVVYEARKSMDGFELTEYMHTFDEPRPALGFDRVKAEIFFAGGRYVVRAPGIEH